MLVSFAVVPTIAFAGTNIDGTNYVALSNDSFLVTSDGEMAVISLNETEHSFTTNVDSIGDANDGYFIIDKEAETIYSSYTDATFTKDEFMSLADDIPANYSNRSSNTVVKYISYKQLASIIGFSGTASSIAGGILTILGYMGLVAANPISGVVSLVGMIVAIVSTQLPSNSANHGIKVTLYKTKVTKHQPGGATTIDVYRISGLSTY